jgi:two-component system nitrogen regulation sensor histidine kinase GlnL
MPPEPQLISARAVPSGPSEPPRSAQDIIAAHPVATLLIDRDGRIAFANAKAESLLNMARSALVGSAIGSVLRIADPLMDSAIWMTDKNLSAYDIMVHAGRNEAVEMDILVNPLLDDDSWRIVALHIHGQSQRIGIRRGALGAKSATGAAAMLAHEIKNPLSGIRGAAQLLEQSVTPDELPLARLVREEVDRIVALIDRVEVFGDERPVEREAINIHVVLDRVKLLAKSGIARNITFTEEYDPSLPPVYGNRDQLIQVCLNLVKNAAESLERTPKGEIRLSTAFRPGIRIAVQGVAQRISLPLEIIIEDNGPGVPQDLMPILFDPFITTKTNGSGLGLALVAKIVGDHGGVVDCDSRPGRTRFRILLPVAKGLRFPEDNEVTAK